MNLEEYVQLDGVGLARLIVSGQVSKGEVEVVARDALGQADADLNALALPVFDAALDFADDGVLAGVPLVIKDSGPVAQGVPFFLGSRSVERAVARHDATVMSRFRAAGTGDAGVFAGRRSATSTAFHRRRRSISIRWALTRTTSRGVHDRGVVRRRRRSRSGGRGDRGLPRAGRSETPPTSAVCAAVARPCRGCREIRPDLDRRLSG